MAVINDVAAEPRATEIDTTRAQLAERWECSAKTIEVWAGQCNEIFSLSPKMPLQGPFNPQQTALIDLYGKHVSKLAYRFHEETGQTRRLSALEFKRLVQSQGNQQPQPSPSHGFYAPPSEVAEDDHYEALEHTETALARIANDVQSETQSAIQAFDEFENSCVDALAFHLSPQVSAPRRMSKLVQRLGEFQGQRNSKPLPTMGQSFALAFTPNRPMLQPSS